MADAQGDTPQNRRYADPFNPMSAGFTAPIRADGHCDDDPHPQIHFGYESGVGTWAGSRPDRARANNANYGAHSRSETATPEINGPSAPSKSPGSADKPEPWIPTPCG